MVTHHKLSNAIENMYKQMVTKIRFLILDLLFVYAFFCFGFVFILSSFVGTKDQKTCAISN